MAAVAAAARRQPTRQPAAALALGQGVAQQQPVVQARGKPLLQLGQFTYRDLNNNGKLDQYENWRLPVDVRVRDLVKQMTLEEKAGMLLIDTLNAPNAPAAMPGAAAAHLVNDEGMKRFIFRSSVQLSGPVSPQRAAEFTNSVQELAEATRLGIPVVFKSNARNHYDRSARAGINEPAGSFSEWPKEPGLAAIRDMALVRDFGDTIGQEWAAIGLRGSYAYMADTATEPRWFRVHETFSESADLNADIMKNLVLGWQGGPVTPEHPGGDDHQALPGRRPCRWRAGRALHVRQVRQLLGRPLRRSPEALQGGHRRGGLGHHAVLQRAGRPDA
jgi:beta-glucosidase